MEKILGPFDGFYVAVYVRDLGQLGTSYLGQYKICQRKPVDFFSADFVRSKCVEGISGSMEEAQEIALRLARLQIDTLWSQLAAPREATAPAARVEESGSRHYAPTLPCPL